MSTPHGTAHQTTEMGWCSEPLDVTHAARHNNPQYVAGKVTSSWCKKAFPRACWNDLAPDIWTHGRFLMMGGECNYLLRVSRDTHRLEFVPDCDWKTVEMLSWQEGDIQDLLDKAEVMLQQVAAQLRVPVHVCWPAAGACILHHCRSADACSCLPHHCGYLCQYSAQLQLRLRVCCTSVGWRLCHKSVAILACNRSGWFYIRSWTGQPWMAACCWPALVKASWCCMSRLRALCGGISAWRSLAYYVQDALVLRPLLPRSLICRACSPHRLSVSRELSGLCRRHPPSTRCAPLWATPDLT